MIEDVLKWPLSALDPRPFGPASAKFLFSYKKKHITSFCTDKKKRLNMFPKVSSKIVAFITPTNQRTLYIISRQLFCRMNI